MGKRQLLISLAAIGSLLPTVPAAIADRASVEEAVRLYQSHNYSQAALLFDKALMDTRLTPNEVYYAGLTYQQLNQLDKAEGAYQSLVQKFPNSEVGKYAGIALKNLQRSIDSKPGTVLPRETWVPFKRAGTHILVDAEINQRPTEMIFDTGAESTLFTFMQFQRLGLPAPSGPPTSIGMGVGGTKPTPIWRVPVNLKVGRIERRGFVVGVSQISQPMCLLGQDFYRGYQYTVDDKNHTVLFKRAESNDSGGGSVATMSAAGNVTVGANGSYMYNVPYTLQGKEMIVQAEINGRPCKMIFDTGAGCCFFTSEQLRAVGVDINSIPTTNQAVAGVSGMVAAKFCKLPSIKLGPLKQTNVVTAVADKAMAPYPLLGQTFFKDYQYTIDTGSRVIHFSSH